MKTKSRTARLFCLTAVALLFVLPTGCAARAPLHFAPQGVMRVTYNPNNCSELPDGKFKCKDVIFTTGIIDVSQKQK